MQLVSNWHIGCIQMTPDRSFKVYFGELRLLFVAVLIILLNLLAIFSFLMKTNSGPRLQKYFTEKSSDVEI